MNESAVNHKANNSISKRVARRQTWKNNDNELRVNWTVHLIMKDIFFGKEEKKYKHKSASTTVRRPTTDTCDKRECNNFINPWNGMDKHNHLPSKIKVIEDMLYLLRYYFCWETEVYTRWERSAFTWHYIVSSELPAVHVFVSEQVPHTHSYSRLSSDNKNLPVTCSLNHLSQTGAPWLLPPTPGVKWAAHALRVQ